MHTGDEPDDAQQRSQNGDGPALLHFGQHQQIHGAAQQRTAHGHIERQHRVGGEEDAAHQGEHQKQGGKDAHGHQILDGQSFFYSRLHGDFLLCDEWMV